MDAAIGDGVVHVSWSWLTHFANVQGNTAFTHPVSMIVSEGFARAWDQAGLGRVADHAASGRADKILSDALCGTAEPSRLGESAY